MGALLITYTILGVPDRNYSIIYPKPYSNDEGPYIHRRPGVPSTGSALPGIHKGVFWPIQGDLPKAVDFLDVS